MLKTLRLLAGALPVSILLLAAMAQSCSSQKPKLEVPDTLNMGPVATSRISTLNFPIKNSGIDPLKITALRSSCECITVDSFPRLVAAGDSARVRLRYAAKDSDITDHKSLYFESNDPAKPQREVNLVIKVDHKVARSSKIAVVAFTNKLTDPSALGLPGQIHATLEKAVQMDMNMDPVPPESMVASLMRDRRYRSADSLPDAMREAMYPFGISMTLFGELTPGENGTVNMRVYLQDYMLPKPIGVERKGLARDSVVAQAEKEAVTLLSNVGRVRQQEMMKKMQERIINKNTKLLDKPAPAFEVSAVDGGQTYSPAKFKGKALLMHFFSITCEHCEEEMGWLRGLMDKFGKENIQVIGISVDQDRSKVVAFAQEKKLPYPICLGDESKTILADYYLDATPQTTIIGPDGNVAYNNIGFNSTINANLEKMIKEFKKK